jgi:hypothetical protein
MRLAIGLVLTAAGAVFAHNGLDNLSLLPDMTGLQTELLGRIFIPPWLEDYAMTAAGAVALLGGGWTLYHR